MAASKEAFFRELDELDYLTDDDRQVDDGLCNIIAGSRTQEQICPSARSRSRDTTIRSLARADTAPESLGAVTKDAVVEGPTAMASSSKIQSRSDEGLHTMKRSNTTGSVRNSAETAVSKKRRLNSHKSVPEQLQIFKDLTFFFFPNNNVSPLRRLRIQRAQEYGAVWTEAWGDHVTHVIVDMDLTWDDLLKHLKFESFPGSVAVVNETYPSDCIKFRSVLSPNHTRFAVKGMPSPDHPAQPELAMNESGDSSLPLKPDRNKQQSSQTSSPSKSDRNEGAGTPADLVPARPENARDDGPVPECDSPRERDALDDMIDAAKAAKDLPLDPLENHDEEVASDESDQSSSEASDSDAKAHKRTNRAKSESQNRESWQQKFTCMQKHDGNSNSDNPNARTIEVLQKMLDYYTKTSDHWRVLAYRKAIGALRRQPHKVVSKTQALAIPGIGPRLADKIEEIVCTNRLRRLENTNLTPEDAILQKFLGVYGAGLSQASKWVAQGFRSLEDLKTKASLTRNQRIGVEHYDDFAQRIPRHEVEAHGEVVRKAVQAVDAEMQVIIGGSYRRGAKDSGDIDLLITKPDATLQQIRDLMTDEVIPKLFAQGFLQASLAATSRGDGSKWHGASTLPESTVWRRIDLLFVPGAELGAALIYFTGNDIFNRSLRLLASKKGMCLNQRGLFKDVLRGDGRVKQNAGALLEARDEKQIFAHLGVPWRPPEHRIC